MSTPKASDTPKTPDKKPAEDKKKATPPAKKEQTKQTDTSDKKDELWDDGMKIPDWLKADDEK